MDSVISDNQQLIQLKAKLFRGFADPSRLSIIQALTEDEKSVGELSDYTGLSQPNVSNHLRCLADCGLVNSERDGRFTYYRLSDDRILTILEKTGELLSETAKGVYECTRYDINN